MKESLEQELAETYPEMYNLYNADVESIDGLAPPIAVYGFSIGNGWHNLLKSLSETLDRRDVEIEVHQVKEKFGGLRFYHGGVKSDDESESYTAIGAIQQAEEMSRYICESCGESAETRTEGWMRTLCDDCWTEEKSRRRKS